MAGQIILGIGSAILIAQAEGQDPYFQMVDGGSGASMFPPVYNLDQYSVTVDVSVIDDDELSLEIFTVTSISVTNNYTGTEDVMQYNIGTNSFTVTTGVDSPFDDYFTFMYYGENGEEAYRDDWAMSDAIENGFLSIVKWQHPSETNVPVTHTIAVEATGSMGTAFSGSASITGNVYFKYPPYTAQVQTLAELTTEIQTVIGGMLVVLDEYNYYVDDNNEIQQYYIAQEDFDGISIGETYILDGDTKVRFDPPEYTGNGNDFTDNGTNLGPARAILTELGLYPLPEPTPEE